MSDDRLYVVRLLWVDDPTLFAEYQEQAKPILARHGVHIERWLMTEGLVGEGIDRPDQIVMTRFADANAREAFEKRPRLQASGRNERSGRQARQYFRQVRVRRLTLTRASPRSHINDDVGPGCGDAD